MQWLARCAALLWVFVLAGPGAADEGLRLAGRNTETPFAYVADGERSWPITLGAFDQAAVLELQLHRGDEIVQRGQQIDVGNVRVMVTDHLRLRVVAGPETKAAFSLHLICQVDGRMDRQVLRFQPAPAARQVSYISDLVDDLIRIAWDDARRRWRPLDRDGFDQYFRRLQCHGITRLIVWPSPFPTLVNPGNYPAEDWARYAGCAQAILEDQPLQTELASAPGLPAWQWLQMLMRLRLDPSVMQRYAASALDHGIGLSLSFRPFEAALTKYYVVPTFDANGNWLWNFLTLASPATQFHTDKVGFAHYRVLLEQMGQAEAAQLATVELEGVPSARHWEERFRQGHRDLAIHASPVAPIDPTSRVLVRQPDATFRLAEYRTMVSAVEATMPQVTGWSLEATSDTSLRLTGMRWPRGARFLWLSAASTEGRALELAAHGGLTLKSAAGNRLGRVNVSWAFAGDDPEARQTRIAGIASGGQYRTEFQAIEASIALLVKRKLTSVALEDHRLVVDLGPDWSVEMLDFQQPLARREALAEMSTLLELPAFDEIFINTRSHTQLSGSKGDGKLGIRPILEYRKAGANYWHLPIDCGSAPRDLAHHTPWLNRLAKAGSVETMTTWQAKEWTTPCPLDDKEFPWRFHRDGAVARGVRRLLVDIERRFPQTRIRAVIPQRSVVEHGVREKLAVMEKPTGGVYGANLYQHIWSSNNHSLAFGGGMARIDLTGLRIEPVYLGIRYLPPPQPLEVFVEACRADLAGRRGSNFRGPLGFLYEAQETLRAADTQATGRRREAIIRSLLAHQDDIQEVILYESADWLYYLPIRDPHAYLEAAKDP